MIEAYVAELRRALRFRFLLRDRLVAEAEGHLRDSAEALGRCGRAPAEAEREAVARFGPPDVVAAESLRAVAPRGLRRAALLLLAALGLYVLPLFALPENTLPPAPWLERPGYLTWKLYASLGAFGVAVALAVLALGSAWRGWTRVALAAVLAAGAALACSAALGTVLLVQWVDAVPGAGATLALALPATVLTAVLGAVAVAVAVVHAPPEPPASIGRRGRCTP